MTQTRQMAPRTMEKHKRTKEGTKKAEKILGIVFIGFALLAASLPPGTLSFVTVGTLLHEVHFFVDCRRHRGFFSDVFFLCSTITLQKQGMIHQNRHEKLF